MLHRTAMPPQFPVYRRSQSFDVLSESSTPPVRVVRSKTVLTGCMVSGTRQARPFAALWAIMNRLIIIIELVFGAAMENHKAPTTRNCVILFKRARRRLLRGGCTLLRSFLFTDNSTAEACFYKGSSKSKLLHDLVLRLHKLEMDYSLIMHRYILLVNG